MKINKVHEDMRGLIYVMEGGLYEHREITFFTTAKGFARGGDIHTMHDEFDVVLEGKVKYVIGAQECVLAKGQSITVHRNTPHYFVALEDSLVAEWGCPPEEKGRRYQPFRDIVDEINRKC